MSYDHSLDRKNMLKFILLFYDVEHNNIIILSAGLSTSLFYFLGHGFPV
jgi:hypothetical protein